MLFERAGGRMNIRVEQIRKLECGALRGFATVNVGDFIRISDIRIVQPQGREVLIQMPQRSYQMNDGGRTYTERYCLPDDLTKEVEKAILWFWNHEGHTSAPEEPNNQAVADSLHPHLEARRFYVRLAHPATLRIFSGD